MLANILFALIIFKSVTDIDANEIDEKLQELEKEKNDLFKQINVAIEESVRSLQKSNETDALIGLKYMSELKEHLKKVNETVIDENQSGVNFSDINNRRKLHKMKKTDPFDFEAILKPKDMKEKEWKEIVFDRTKMQKQLNEWIVKRQKEKERLQEYRLYKKGLLMTGKFEKCPRFGYKGKKKKAYKDKKKIRPSLTKTSAETANIYDTINPSNKKNAKKNKYPCCRKCCKKSYMGCL